MTDAPWVLHENDKVYFHGEKLPYTVQAVSTSGRWAVCTKPFAARRTVIYSVVDLERKLRGIDNHFGYGYETKRQCKVACRLFTFGWLEYSGRRRPIPLLIERINHQGNDDDCRKYLEAS